jgi:predicted metal-dependent hydrolase
MSLQRQKFFSVEDQEYQLLFRKIKGAKTMRITLAAQRIIVTGPFFVPFFALEKFWESKKTWALNHKAILQAPVVGPRAITHEHFLATRAAARVLVEKKLTQWNALYRFQWNRVTIRNQKTRFGSCSAQKNLSFHVCIVDLPEALQDYLIVHELCHLQEMNHGSRFWARVEQAIPDARLRARQLTGWRK